MEPVYGMYLGGYGNFVSTTGTIGETLTENLSLNAAYQLGSRLVVDNNDSSKRIGARLTQNGAIVGLEYSFLGTGPDSALKSWVN